MIYAARLPWGDSTCFPDQVSSATLCLCTTLFLHPDVLLCPNFLPHQSAYKRSQAKWEDICWKWIFSEFERLFGALLQPLAVTWHFAESESWWWISREQRRSNQAGLSSHQTMLLGKKEQCAVKTMWNLGAKKLYDLDTCQMAELVPHENDCNCVFGLLS